LYVAKHISSKQQAWSQNLGHEQVLMTFLSYGHVESPRQGEVIQGPGETRKPAESSAEEIAEAVFKRLQSRDE